MQSRLVAMEEAKDISSVVRTNQSRALPLKILQYLFLVLFLVIGFLSFSMHILRYLGVENIAPVARSIIHPCFEEPTSIRDLINPPAILLHNMSDKELFWRASFVPRIHYYPFRRVPKIAFMFLTKGLLPHAPLWERFFKGHHDLYSIYVHPLPSYVSEFSASSVFYKRQIPSQVAKWGEMSMCDAERRLLANALLDISNECFMGSVDEPGPYGRGRYNENMTPLVNLSQWRKGSQWFEINRKLAINIIEDTTYYPKFNDFCRPACYVDEHYFQTMLTMQEPHHLANRSLTWVDWSRGGAHPGTFGKNDITDEFFKKIFQGKSCMYNNEPSTFCFLFARKFSPSAVDPLLGLASKTFGF